MKKFLTALIAFVMCFSVVTTAFAATPDETSDSDLISDIKQAMLDTYYGDEKPNFIEVRIYGTASDGGVYFDFIDSFTHWADEVEFDLGNYTISYPSDCPVMLYKIIKYIHCLMPMKQVQLMMICSMNYTLGEIFGERWISSKRAKIHLSF